MYFSDFAVIVFVDKWESEAFIVTVTEHTTKFKVLPLLGVLRTLKYNNMKSIFETDEKVQEESKIIRQVKYAIKRKGRGYNKYITFKLLYNNNWRWNFLKSTKHCFFNCIVLHSLCLELYFTWLSKFSLNYYSKNRLFFCKCSFVHKYRKKKKKTSKMNDFPFETRT